MSTHDSARGTPYPPQTTRLPEPIRPPGALELVEDGLNTLAAELERLEHRLAPILTEHRPAEANNPAIPTSSQPTGLHAQARRVHALVSALSDITDRVAL